MAATISFTVFAMFQATFAMITPALITGAVAERANFYFCNSSYSNISDNANNLQKELRF